MMKVAVLVLAVALAVLALATLAAQPSDLRPRVCYDTHGPIITGTMSVRDGHLYINGGKVLTDVACYVVK